MRLLVAGVLLFGCGHPAASSPDAMPDTEVLTTYAGTLVLHPHGSMYSQTSNIEVTLGTTHAVADGCTFGNMTNHDDGTLTFACGGGALHWTKLAFEDAAVDYDFTGMRE